MLQRTEFSYLSEILNPTLSPVVQFHLEWGYLSNEGGTYIQGNVMPKLRLSVRTT